MQTYVHKIHLFFLQKASPQDGGCLQWKDLLVKLFSCPVFNLKAWAWCAWGSRGRERREKKKPSNFVPQIAKLCVVTGCRNQASFRNLSLGRSFFLGGIKPGPCWSWMTPKKSRSTQCYWSMSCCFPPAHASHSLWPSRGGFRWALVAFPTNSVGIQALAALCESCGTLKQKMPL